MPWYYDEKGQFVGDEHCPDEEDIGKSPSQKAIVLDTPEAIEAYRLLAIKGRLKLEMAGLRFRVSTFGAVKREFGFKGNRQKVYDQYVAMLRERGILKDVR